MERLTSRTALALAGVMGLALAGCTRKPAKETSLRDQMRDKIAKQVPKDPQLSVDMSGNQFTVDNENGQRLLEADVQKVEGKVVPGKGVEGAVKMLQTKCRLFKNGKLEMTLDSPEATWDGFKLISEKQVHAVTAAQDKIIDANRSIWTAKTGILELEKAKLQSMNGKKLEMTGEAPKVVVQNQVATMGDGATGRTPTGDQMQARQLRWHFKPKRMEGRGRVHLVNSDGGQLTADSMNWTLDSGKVEADGNVTLLQDGTTVTGQRLRADIKLQKGRLSGRTRVVMKKGPPVLKKKTG